MLAARRALRLTASMSRKRGKWEEKGGDPNLREWYTWWAIAVSRRSDQAVEAPTRAREEDKESDPVASSIHRQSRGQTR